MDDENESSNFLLLNTQMVLILRIKLVLFDQEDHFDLISLHLFLRHFLVFNLQKAVSRWRYNLEIVLQ